MKTTITDVDGWIRDFAVYADKQMNEDQILDEFVEYAKEWDVHVVLNSDGECAAQRCARSCLGQFMKERGLAKAEERKAEPQRSQKPSPRKAEPQSRPKPAIQIHLAARATNREVEAAIVSVVEAQGFLTHNQIKDHIGGVDRDRLHAIICRMVGEVNRKFIGAVDKRLVLRHKTEKIHLIGPSPMLINGAALSWRQAANHPLNVHGYCYEALRKRVRSGMSLREAFEIPSRLPSNFRVDS